MDPKASGEEMRRRVLGSDHVDRATAATTDLDRGFQSWITDAIWGGIWTRERLDLRARSMITIAVLAALGHDELELHLRATENTGVTAEEVSEILLHVAAYAGAPAANKAFEMAKRVLGEEAR
ncbi:MAG: carboxymuconolactone decarboxylase family protein [Actinomycetes bacterium]|jgi:4-carboxymuconolactone decarboxylase|nr:4-carboxymuconolactone decarboxylase [Acidimicrobiia bacterium]